MDALLSPQILLEDPAADVSFIAALSTNVSGAVVSPVDGVASAAASDDAAPADDSRAPTAPLYGVAEGTVPLVAGATFDAAVSSAEAGALVGCRCSKCHCRRRRLLRSLQQREHRHLHIFRLKPLLNTPAITPKKRFRYGATCVLPVTSDRRNSP